jgi:hypothetical protein
LFAKNISFGFLKIIGIFIIHEEPNQVKDSGKITDHKNDMNGFENGIKHLKNLGTKIKIKRLQQVIVFSSVPKEFLN